MIKSLSPQEFSLRHPRYELSAKLRCLSEQLFGFTMHYNRHRESDYVMVNRAKTLPNTYLELVEYQDSSCTYLELVEYQDSSCRLLRHSKMPAPVHSFNGNSWLSWVHCPAGTQSLKSLLDIIYSASCPKPNIACSGFHAKEASRRICCLSSTWLTWSRSFSWPQNVWHWQGLFHLSASFHNNL
jgi:hypothetical protein